MIYGEGLGVRSGWQEKERINKLYCRETMNVHIYSVSNIFKWDFVDQQKGCVCQWQWSVDYVCYTSCWMYNKK